MLYLKRFLLFTFMGILLSACSGIEVLPEPTPAYDSSELKAMEIVSGTESLSTSLACDNPESGVSIGHVTQTDGDTFVRIELEPEVAMKMVQNGKDVKVDIVYVVWVEEFDTFQVLGHNSVTDTVQILEGIDLDSPVMLDLAQHQITVEQNLITTCTFSG